MCDLRLSLTHSELMQVEKPARYLGGETNSVPAKREPALRVCLVFPDLYELGMSNLAVKIFYEQLNLRDDVSAERAFAPWVDFEKLLLKKQLKLFSLESGRPLSDFDVIFVTIPYEMTFTNILNILYLSQIPLRYLQRNHGPLIIGGGPSASNPLPLAAFFDAILIGEGEEAIEEICDCIIKSKKSDLNVTDTRKALSEIEGLWVDQFPKSVKRRVLKSFSCTKAPVNHIVPNVRTVHNRATIEIFRGCAQGCRFCNAGYYYRPVRERKASCLIDASNELLQNTGEEALGLLSLSTTDYSCLAGLIEGLENTRLYPEQTVSIPSMRMSKNTIQMLENTSKIKSTGLTFAPEAGSQRLRDIIRKDITADEIMNVIQIAKGEKYRKIKLYFMIGLPFENDEDILAIADLINKIEKTVRYVKPRRQINVSLSGFIPKPFTPFQWAGQNSIEELKRKRRLVIANLKNTKCSWREEYLCMLEAVLSRGDKKTSELIEAAWQNGARFDGWNEQFNTEAWEKAFETTKIDSALYTGEKKLDSKLPWSFVDFNTPISYLKNEYLMAEKKAGELP